MVHDDEDGVPDLSNKQLLKVLLDEIAANRRELQEEFREGMGVLRRELKQDIASLASRVDALAVDVKSLRLEVHQNQVTFMTNHEELAQKVAVLEVA